MRKNAGVIITTLLIAVTVKKAAKAKNILFMPAMGAPSHVKSMIPLAERLMQDGHNVSLVQYYSEDRQKVTHDSINFIYIPLSDLSLIDSEQQSTIWRRRGMNPWIFLKSAWRVSAACLHSRQAEGHAEFYGSMNALKWDLLVVDNMFQPCGIISCTNSRDQACVDYSTTPMLEYTRQRRAVGLPRSVVISITAEEFRPGNFRYRLAGVLDLLVEETFWFIFVGAMVIAWREESTVFSRAHVSDHYANAVYSLGSISSMLDIPLPQAVNTFSLDYACPTTAKLSVAYQNFVEDPSSKGTIIFSFGHSADWRGAPAEVIQAVSSAMESLSEYRVVWQFNGNVSMVSSKSHVLMEPWVPLPSLLGHPKTVLFVTHSGIKSFREAICFGVPMLSIPLFGDQLRNTVRAGYHGLGVTLDKTKLTRDSFYKAVREVLSDERYKERVRKLGAMLSDSSMDEIAKGSFWIGFYLRHPNSTFHLRLRGTAMSFSSYHCCDVLAVLFVLLYSFYCAMHSYSAFHPVSGSIGDKHW